MKRFAYFTYLISCLLILLSCSEGKVAKMRQGLDSINMVNRSGKPFTVADVEPYVQFFDKHGEPNDRLLAHYLLGLAYYDHGEAPMALRCYQDALDCVDTTSNDCDYAQLSRVYMQMSNVFYYQGLYHKQLEYIDHSVRYAWRGGDTLAAIMNYEMKSHGYRKLNMTDSMMEVCSTAYKLYNKYGYSKYAAIVLSYTLSTLIGKKEYPKAKQNMDIYESESGYFDSLRDIEKGREIYYKIKGYYYKGIGKSDSAEFYFRKELRDGKDFNNQNAGAMGLAQLYQGQHQSDSAAKYSIYAYAMNDSMYAQRTTETVERMQAMYDYSRNQEIARKKSEEARQNREKWLFTLTLLFGFIIVASILAYRFIRKRRKGLKLYIQSLTELRQLRMELNALSQHKEEYSQIILEKDKKIDYLEQRVLKYGKQVYFKTANAERCLKESPVYQKFEKMAIQGQILTEDDWTKLRVLINEYLPGFDDFMTTNLYKLKTNECRIIILLRLHFKAVDITGMMGISKSQVSQICTEIMRKLFNSQGSSKELSAKLSKIF